MAFSLTVEPVDVSTAAQIASAGAERPTLGDPAHHSKANMYDKHVERSLGQFTPMSAILVDELGTKRFRDALSTSEHWLTFVGASSSRDQGQLPAKFQAQGRTLKADETPDSAAGQHDFIELWNRKRQEFYSLQSADADEAAASKTRSTLSIHVHQPAPGTAQGESINSTYSWNRAGRVQVISATHIVIPSSPVADIETSQVDGPGTYDSREAYVGSSLDTYTSPPDKTTLGITVPETEFDTYDMKPLNTYESVEAYVQSSPETPGMAAPAPANSEHSLDVDEDDVDSPYEDDFSATSTSLRSNIVDYEWKYYGRRYHSYQAGAYNFPNDEREQERLDMVHYAFYRALNNRLFLAPIDLNGLWVLDVGTGTGIWAIDVADRYPGARGHWK
ncbi:Uncharacterized protein TCAP_06010 [Tolypocladium capitatum]|uniref:Methyltransferase domain-containing protein n=1 Tax=Tolypocladium capitatum TaxID=45235 RepID=A0A2K3Q939_9HYPO|nr:Uncharacterized protein TCAP_06010 [Tolypocladium capitatum]